MTRHKNKKIFHEDANNREHLSSVEFISGGDFIIDSFVILKKKKHLEKFYFNEEFSDNTTIDLSESDYLTNKLAISFLEHFDVLTSKSTIRQ